MDLSKWLLKVSMRSSLSCGVKTLQSHRRVTTRKLIKIVKVDLHPNFPGNHITFPNHFPPLVHFLLPFSCQSQYVKSIFFPQHAYDSRWLYSSVHKKSSLSALLFGKRKFFPKLLSPLSFLSPRRFQCTNILFAMDPPHMNKMGFYTKHYV